EKGLKEASKASLPRGIQMPDIGKYIGTEDPIVFMENYLLAMGPLGLNNHTLLKLFPRYLTDVALRWYIKNEIAETKT
ncbi:hypothetical protein RF074_19075, partial [Serratia marcescens]|uniref:hypothetical protein n=1 Tax=Serratia marcescens TaxID=615 RepID=UPI002813BB92